MQRLLIVDDQEAVRMMLIQSLEHWGYVVTAVPGGAEALEAMATATFDAVVMDITMPRIGGIEVCRRLKMLSSKPLPPIWLMSGTWSEEIEQDAKEAGAIEVLMKPFSNSFLAERLKAHWAKTPSSLEK